MYWSYFHVASRTFVMSSDDDRFTNHSDNPNTRVVGDCTVAVRDIQPGEEITNDYNELVMLNFPTPKDYGVKWARGQRCSAGPLDAGFSAAGARPPRRRRCADLRGRGTLIA